MVMINNMTIEGQQKMIASIYREQIEKIIISQQMARHSPLHKWTIVMSKGNPNRTECIKCGKICETQEEFETGECEKLEKVKL
jgi:hypothetical protein